MDRIVQHRTTSKDTLLSPLGLGVESPSDLIREGPVTISASQAGMIRRELRYENQTRDLTPAGEAHIRNLADIMQGDSWRKDKLDFADFDGRLIIMNGHHRLGAQALSGKKMEWIIVIHQCRTDDDVSKLYVSFDTNVRVRDTSTVLSALDLSAKLGIDKSTARALWEAVPILANNFDFSRPDRMALIKKVIDRRSAYAEAFKREIIAWECAVSEATQPIKKKLKAQGALAVALIAFRYQPKTAYKFWNGIALDDNLSRGDPRHTYHHYLSGALEPPKSQVVPKPHEWSAICAARCWNAWVNEETISFVKPQGLSAGRFRIDGTSVDHSKDSIL